MARGMHTHVASPDLTVLPTLHEFSSQLFLTPPGRTPLPSRVPQPVRPDEPSRTSIPSRQPYPTRQH
jgi:hypothetical protein